MNSALTSASPRPQLAARPESVPSPGLTRNDFLFALFRHKKMIAPDLRFAAAPRFIFLPPLSTDAKLSSATSLTAAPPTRSTGALLPLFEQTVDTIIGETPPHQLILRCRLRRLALTPSAGSRSHRAKRLLWTISQTRGDCTKGATSLTSPTKAEIGRRRRWF